MRVVDVSVVAGTVLVDIDVGTVAVVGSVIAILRC